MRTLGSRVRRTSPVPPSGEAPPRSGGRGGGRQGSLEGRHHSRKVALEDSAAVVESSRRHLNRIQAANSRRMLQHEDAVDAMSTDLMVNAQQRLLHSFDVQLGALRERVDDKTSELIQAEGAKEAMGVELCKTQFQAQTLGRDLHRTKKKLGVASTELGVQKGVNRTLLRHLNVEAAERRKKESEVNKTQLKLQKSSNTVQQYKELTAAQSAAIAIHSRQNRASQRQISTMAADARSKSKEIAKVSGRVRETENEKHALEQEMKAQVDETRVVLRALEKTGADLEAATKNAREAEKRWTIAQSAMQERNATLSKLQIKDRESSRDAKHLEKVNKALRESGAEVRREKEYLTSVVERQVDRINVLDHSLRTNAVELGKKKDQLVYDSKALESLEGDLSVTRARLERSEHHRANMAQNVGAARSSARVLERKVADVRHDARVATRAAEGALVSAEKDWRKERKGLGLKVASLEAEVSRGVLQKRETKTEVQALERDNKSLASRYSRLRVEQEVLAKRSEAQADSQIRMQHRVHKLQEELQQETDRVTPLRRVVAAVEKENSGLRKNVGTERMRFISAQTNHIKEHNLRVEAESKLGGAHAEFKAARAVARRAQEDASSAEGVTSEHRIEVARLRHTIKRLEVELVKSQGRALAAHRERVESSHRGEDKAMDASIAKSQLRDRARIAEHEVSRLRREANVSLRNRGMVEGQKGAVEARLHAATAEVADLKKSNSALRQKANLLSAQLSTARANASALAKQFGNAITAKGSAALMRGGGGKVGRGGSLLLASGGLPSPRKRRRIRSAPGGGATPRSHNSSRLTGFKATNAPREHPPPSGSGVGGSGDSRGGGGGGGSGYSQEAEAELSRMYAELEEIHTAAVTLEGLLREARTDLSASRARNERLAVSVSHHEIAAKKAAMACKTARKEADAAKQEAAVLRRGMRSTLPIMGSLELQILALGATADYTPPTHVINPSVELIAALEAASGIGRSSHPDPGSLGPPPPAPFQNTTSPHISSSSPSHPSDGPTPISLVQARVLPKEQLKQLEDMVQEAEQDLSAMAAHSGL